MMGRIGASLHNPLRKHATSLMERLEIDISNRDDAIARNDEGISSKNCQIAALKVDLATKCDLIASLEEDLESLQKLLEKLIAGKDEEIAS